MKPVKLGVVGCGVIGTQHVQSAYESEFCQVTAVTDTLEDRARNLARQYEVARVAPDARALIEDPEVEAVILALPTSIRTPLALHAFACGKHVLLEKPAACHASEIEEFVRRHGSLTVASCSSRYRFLPSSQFVTDFLATGALGDLRVIHFRCTTQPGPPPTTPPPAWRVSKALNGGGILANLGIYELDFLFGITGWRLTPRHVLAQTWSVPPQFECHVAPGSDAEEHFACFVTCEEGTAISFERGERVAAQPEGEWKIIGTKGSLQLAFYPGEGKKIVFDNSSTEQGVFSEVIWEGDEPRTPLRMGVVEDFARAIRFGKEPLTNLERALTLQKLVDSIYVSAQTQRPVECGKGGVSELKS